MTKMFLVLHVVGSVFIVGPMAILPMTAMRALRAGNAPQLTTLAKSTELFSMVSIIVAVVGFPLMWDNRRDLTLATPWILGSVVLYVVALLLNLFLVLPAIRRAAAQLNVASSSPSPNPEGSNHGYAAISAGSGVVTFLLVAVIVLMTWRP
jgi:uncharacterized membrane protein